MQVPADRFIPPVCRTDKNTSQIFKLVLIHIHFHRILYIFKKNLMIRTYIQIVNTIPSFYNHHISHRIQDICPVVMSFGYFWPFYSTGINPSFLALLIAAIRNETPSDRSTSSLSLIETSRFLTLFSDTPNLLAIASVASPWERR